MTYSYAGFVKIKNLESYVVSVNININLQI